jgi:hypothetical protein
MKKIAKISLVAAVAVAGLTTANAQPLEQAIKGVEVTGSVVYRYNDQTTDTNTSTASTQTNNYKAALGLAAPVNDFVKLNTRFVAGSPSVVAGGASNPDTGFATLETSTHGDQNVDLQLSNVYFGYTGIKNTTVNVGKQGLTTPWTVAIDSDGNEQTGTGILALSTLGNVTLAGAYFNQTNLDDSGNPLVFKKTDNGIADNQASGANDVATVGTIVAMGPVTADAWFLDSEEYFDSYTIGAKAATTLGAVKLTGDVRYTSLDLDNSVNENDMVKALVTAKAGIFDAKLGWARTDKDGGLVALDNDAVTNIQGWSVSANDKMNADFWLASVGVDVLSDLNLSANYTNVDFEKVTNVTAVEQEEIYAQLVYKMSKNLSGYVRYGVYTEDTSTIGQSRNDTVDDTRGRLQVEYTF